MRPTNERVLRSVRETLAHRVAPRIHQSDIRALLGAVDLALVELLRRDGPRLQELIETDRGLRKDIERGWVLLGKKASASQDTPATLDAAYAEHDRLEAEATDLVSALRAERRDAAWSMKAEAIIHVIVARQLDFVATESATVPLEASERADPSVIDETRLGQEIGTRLCRAGPVTVKRVVSLSGGFSRVTLAVDWIDAEGEGALVIRKQKPGGVMDGVALDVTGEYPVLRYAKSKGVTVPGQFWCEPDPSVLGGGPFIAMERAAGGSLGSAMGATGVTDDILSQIAAELAKLHRLPWEENRDALAGAFALDPAAMTVKGALDAYQAGWKALWDRAGLAPSPAMTAAYDYLTHNRPRENVRACLLHGDIGFHNMLFDEGRLSALLDWETAYIGDPAWDVSICKSFVGRYTEWDRFLGWYAEAGGYPVDAQTMEYYRVQRVFCQLIVGEMGQTKFAAIPDAEIEYLVLGIPVRHFFYEDYRGSLPIIAPPRPTPSTE